MQWMTWAGKPKRSKKDTRGSGKSIQSNGHRIWQAWTWICRSPRICLQQEQYETWSLVFYWKIEWKQC
jgi:hypothetical protein